MDEASKQVDLKRRQGSTNAAATLRMSWKCSGTTSTDQPGPMVMKLDLQLMLRVASHCKENPMCTAALGEIVGLELAKGLVEVTNCFAIPSRRDVWSLRDRTDAKELEEKHRKDTEKYKTKIRELLHYVDADCQSIGWYQSMPTSGLFDPAQIEILYQRVSMIEKNSMILAYDHRRESVGRFPFRGFQLTSQYVQLREKQENNELGPQQVARGLENADILNELVVQVKSCVAVDSVLNLMKESDEVRALREACSYMTVANSHEERLSALSSAVSELTLEGERLSKYQKDTSKYQQASRRNFDRKTEIRKQIGEELVAVEEDDQIQPGMQTYDRRVDVPNYMKAILMRRIVT